MTTRRNRKPGGNNRLGQFDPEVSWALAWEAAKADRELRQRMEAAMWRTARLQREQAIGLLTALQGVIDAPVAGGAEAESAQ